MSFVCSIIVVEEIARSRKLYEDILQMKVTGDFGIYNIGFEGGLSLYRKAFFEELTGKPVDSGRHNTLALYYEVDHLEELEKVIDEHGFEFVHKIKTQPWGQRNFRFYDYDDHLLEIAEKMELVFDRLIAGGSTVEEMARLTGYPQAQVAAEVEKRQSK